MNIITAVDNDWGIGYRGKLLFSIPEDMRHFKRLTENKVVIMGYNTLKSLPNSKVLQNRTNIVLSRNKDVSVENAVMCDSIERLFCEVKKFNPADVFIIGGQLVYEQLINYCTHAFITKINTKADADRLFPNIDKMSNWELVSESPVKIHDGLSYVFTEYTNNSSPNRLT